MIQIIRINSKPVFVHYDLHQTLYMVSIRLLTALKSRILVTSNFRKNVYLMHDGDLENVFSGPFY